MTGAQLSAILERRYTPIGPCYQPHPGKVIIPLEMLRGSDPDALFSVAHEWEHFRQHLCWPWLFPFRWFLPITWFLEADASLRALKTVEPYISSNQEAELRKKVRWWWWSYS